MNIAEKKYQLIELILAIDDIKTIKDINKFISSRAKKGVNNAKLASIKRGLSQIQNGSTVSHEEVKKIYQK